MAPECVRNKETSFASDIWSLGCILYHFYLGFLPFRGKSDYLIFINSTIAKFKLRDYSNNLIPESAKNLIEGMIVVDPTQRLSIDQLIEDSFFYEVRNLQAPPPLD